jgi:hypothetical protein
MRRKIVEGYHASGLTVRHFCQRDNVAEQSLQNWIRKIIIYTCLFYRG